jgi:hypothetical protein
MGFTIAPMLYQSPRIDLEALLEKSKRRQMPSEMQDISLTRE